jgi:recombination protein RecA
MERTKISEKLSKQMKQHVSKPKEPKEDFEGNFDTVISTGSTLLDLAISGKRIHGGGLPGGILVEAFGPSQSGKTALLSEVSGNIGAQGGESQFNDPEARLDKEFASIFGMKLNPKNYYRPDTVTELFTNIRAWEPQTDVKVNTIHGIFADSLAALSTNTEMEKEEGDKMGMRRAKEFSEQLRRTCRVIKKKNFLMVCSNQIRVSTDTYGPKFTTPGGEAVKFYASVRLKFNSPDKINKVVRVGGKEVKKVIGIETEIEVVKSVDEPYRKAPVIIIYGYGIDDVRANLQYIKDYKKNTMYCAGELKLSQSMEDAIQIVEEKNLENELREEVIDLWEKIERKFETVRKSKK